MENGKEHYIKIEDVAPFSNYSVDVMCDYCGKIYSVKYNDYNKQIRLVKKSACNSCASKKQEDVMMLKYNVRNACYLDDTIEKKKQTSIKKYGCEYYITSNAVKSKIKKVNMKKYGVEYAIASEEVRNKIKSTNIKKYGTEYPFQNEEYLNYMNEMMIKKYGTKLVVGSTSSQQIYICEELNGVLNLYIDGYYADIVVDNSFVVEYDGGGHTLLIKMGKVSKDEFYKKERKRESVLISNGLKIIRVINPKDIKIEDAHINYIKDILFNFNKNYDVCDYILETNKTHYR